MATSNSTRDVGTQAVESLVKQVRVKMSKLNVKEQFMSPPTDTKVYNEKGEQVITKVRSGTKGRFEEFADDYEVRQQARRSFLNGFLNKQMDFKSRSGDETLLCLYDGDRREKTWYSTNPAMLSYTDRHNTSSNVTTSLILESSNPGSEVDPATPAPVASTPAPSPRPFLVPAPNLAPVPSFHELAAASPPRKAAYRGRAKPTARSSKDADVCRICGILYESTADIATDSPWMGCVGLGRGRFRCNYWVHAVCKGFADADEDDLEKLNFYCNDHNPRAAQAMSRKSGRGGRKGKRKL